MTIYHQKNWSLGETPSELSYIAPVIRQLKKTSTLYLTDKALQQVSEKTYSKVTRKLSQVLKDNVQTQVTHITQQSQDTSTPPFNSTTNILLSPEASERPYFLNPTTSKKPSKQLVDPLQKVNKQTFVKAHRDQNMYYLYQMLRKIPKPEKVERRESPDRKSQVKQLVAQSRARGQTFVRFGFRSHERNENHYIQQYMDEITKMLPESTLGSMSVSDLWSNQQVVKFLVKSHLNSDKLMLQRINKMLMKDRVAQEQVELTKQKQIYKQLHERTKFENTHEHFGKQLFYPKKHYHQQILANQIMRTSNSQDKIGTLVNRIDNIHDDNLRLYQSMSSVIDKLKSPQKKRRWDTNKF